MNALSSRSVAAAILAAVVGCGSSGDAPAGSCKTGGTATGSYAADCNQCARDNCNKELAEKAGSGWPMQYFGGDGACAEFNACICQCLSSGKNPIMCAVSVDCFAKMDAACTAAVGAAQACLNQHCSTVCR